MTHPSHPEPKTFYKKPVWRRLYAFIIGPALLSMVILAVLVMNSILIGGDPDPHQLVQTIRSGGEHRRWQAAFALTQYLQPNIVQQDAVLLREKDEAYKHKLAKVRILIPDLLDIWHDAKHTNTQLKRFLALAFSYLADPRTAPVLLRALKHEDIELVHYALTALTRTVHVANGNDTLGGPLFVGLHQGIIDASKRKEASIRAASVYLLGLFDDTQTMERLQQSLNDAAPSVRWNTAFALARRGNHNGEVIIAEILDRGKIYHAASPKKQRELFLNAVRTAGMLRSPMLQKRLAQIAKADAIPLARSQAMKILATKVK